MKVSKKICIYCGASMAGRSDKKFCDDACRAGFHNQSRQECSALCRETDSILHLNRKILSSVVHSNARLKLPKNRLLSRGFRPDFITRLAAGPDGRIIRCYYEFGILRLSESEVEVFRMNEWESGRTSAVQKLA